METEREEKNNGEKIFIRDIIWVSGSSNDLAEHFIFNYRSQQMYVYTYVCIYACIYVFTYLLKTIWAGFSVTYYQKFLNNS